VRRTPALVQAARAASGQPVVTYSIIGINLLVYLLEWVSGGWVVTQFSYAPALTADEPWLMVTSMFLHSQTFLLHIAFNMYALFVLGPPLENFLGRARFLALYLIAGFGGSVAVLLLLNPFTSVVGASGAIFGLFGAFFVVQRRLGANTTQLFIIIAINLVIGFVVPGIGWQAHVGGLVIGAAIAAIYVRTRRLEHKWLQVGLVAALAVALIIVTVVKVTLS
jgi:membrane associated rhomboid family serine protease